MYLIWMPYTTFSDGRYGSTSITIGPATIWPDTDHVWNSQLHLPRPSWFNAFRDFPQAGSNQVGLPRRGSVIISQDEEWLRENYRRLIAVIYFIGDKACLDGVPYCGNPSERFYAMPLEISATATELVQILTKHGFLMEDENSLKITPPLLLRGQHGAYRLDMVLREHQALINILNSSPDHRLVTACLNYFLAQTGDPLVFSFEQDYASYCACLEAAFDIKGIEHSNNIEQQTRKWWQCVVGYLFRQKHQFVRKSLIGQLCDKVCNIYVENDTDDIKDILVDFLRGLYSCRSIHVHGLSDFTIEEEERQRHQAYLQFMKRRGNYSVLRALCRDIIIRQLWNQPGAARSEFEQMSRVDSADKLIRKALQSDDAWGSIHNRANQTGSAQLISGLSGTELERFCDEAGKFIEEFDWGFLQQLPSEDTLRKDLRAYLDAYHRSLNGTTVMPAMHDLITLYTATRYRPESSAIEAWAIRNPNNPMTDTSLSANLTAIVWQLAHGFVRR